MHPPCPSGEGWEDDRQETVDDGVHKRLTRPVLYPGTRSSLWEGPHSSHKEFRQMSGGRGLGDPPRMFYVYGQKVGSGSLSLRDPTPDP